jgi:hypothetical protein
MASLIYNSCLEDAAKGAIDFDSDTFKTLLVTSSYTPNKDTHDRADDITNEVANGNGYTTGGATTACTVAKDTANDRITLTFAAASWPTSTITARAAVIYKSTGTASADPLVAYVDFGGDVSSTGATFSVSASVITLQN